MDIETDGVPKTIDSTYHDVFIMNNGMRVLVLFTCHNRIEKTMRAIHRLVDGNADIAFSFVAVDAGSTDGTREALRDVPDVLVIQGRSSLYYSNGMRMAMMYAKDNVESFDYCLLINDDVAFYPGIINKMTEVSGRSRVIVGATCDKEGKLTYGGIKYDKGIHYHLLGPESSYIKADTFNANCVLIPWKAFMSSDIIDDHYVHSLGDFDYGLMLRDKGFEILTLDEYIGVCERNPISRTWQDRSLSRIERVKKKECVKGAPAQQWFYYLKKHFGLRTAILHTITPFLRIVAGR